MIFFIMLVNILIILLESILFFVLWFIIISIASLFFRFEFSWKIFKTLFWLITINSVVHFLSWTNPEQNHIVLLLIVSFFYLYLFFIIKLIKKWTDKVWKLKYYQFFILFILSLFLFWKWEYLEVTSESISSEISIGSNWEIFYKWVAGTKSNVWFFNDYWKKTYDTIKYDIDLDGFVDIKTIDKNDDGVIDNTIIYTYSTQKILLLTLLFWAIILVYLFWNWWKKIDKNDNEDNENNLWKKIDLSALKEEKIEIINTNKIIALTLIFSLLFAQSWIVSAKSYEEMSTYERQQTPEYKRGIEIWNYFKNIESCKYSYCEWASSDVNNFLKNYYNNEKYNKIWTYIFSQFDKILEDSQTYCSSWWYSTYACGKNNDKINIFDTRFLVIYKIILDFKLARVNDSSKLDHPELWFFIALNAMADKKLNPDDYNFMTSNEAPATETEIVDIEEDKIINTKVKVDTDIMIEKDEKSETVELSDDEYEKALLDSTKDWKAVIDISWVALEVINSVVWKTDVTDINEAKKIAWNISKGIKNTVWNDWMKVVDKLAWLWKKMKDVELKSPKFSQKLKGDLWKKIWWISWAIDVIWKIWTVFDIYGDYNDFKEKSGGNKTKTYIWTTTTTILKNLVWSNPIDVWLSVISWGLHLLWYEDTAETVEEFSLWDRSKQLVQDAILHETDETIGAMDQTLDDLIDTFNDKDAWVMKKTSTFITSTLTFTYWMWIFGMNQLLWWAEWVINSVSEK